MIFIQAMFRGNCSYLSSFCPFVILLTGLKNTHTHAQSAPNNTKSPTELNSPSFFVVRNYGLFPLYLFWFTLVQSKRTNTICTVKYLNSSCCVLFTRTVEKNGTTGPTVILQMDRFLTIGRCMQTLTEVAQIDNWVKSIPEILPPSKAGRYAKTAFPWKPVDCLC